MPSPFRIAVFGMGGVGGYYGGKLASRYETSPDVEVIFIARGEHADAIRFRGLRVVSPEPEFVARPTLVTNDPARIEPVDLLVCAVKSYDLDDVARLAPCVGDNTAILPLLNGVDARDRIEGIFPGVDVWDGCVYIIARRSAPGVITIGGAKNQFYFGSKTASRAKLAKVETLLTEAGITAQLVDDMSERLWQKFLFISVMATATSYFDCPIGEIVSDEARVSLLRSLATEAKSVADALRVRLPDNVVEWAMGRIFALPPDATSSMHADFQRGGPTELDTITGIVVRLGRRRGVATPTYERTLSALSARNAERRG